MKNLKKYLANIVYIALILIGINLVNPQVSSAEDSGIGFSVSPILPSTQIDKNLGYFYLETVPGEEQTVEVNLYNQKDEKQTIQLFVEDAYTGTNGNLYYGVDGNETFKQDDTLKNATSQIIKPIGETVDLEPGEKKIASFKVMPPKESYAGVKVGRLVFKSVNKEKDESAVLETYQYAISIILSENGDEYNDGDLQEITLNEVKPTIKRGKRLVIANLQNPQPKRVLNLDLKANITKKGGTKVIKQTKISDFQFAPNSNVDLEVDWGLAELEPGDYTLTLSAKNDYDEINLTKEFKITKDASSKLNKESAFKIETPTWVKIAAVTSGVITLSLSIVIFSRNKKWAKMSNRKRNKKRNKKK